MGSTRGDRPPLRRASASARAVRNSLSVAPPKSTAMNRPSGCRARRDWTICPIGSSDQCSAKLCKTMSWVEGWTALMIAVLFMSGVQLLCLGIVGEYIGRIYDEAKRRPLYIVRERMGFGTLQRIQPAASRTAAE